MNSNYSDKMPICNDSRKCFAQTDNHECQCLQSTYPDGECPFCKENREDRIKHEAAI